MCLPFRVRSRDSQEVGVCSSPTGPDDVFNVDDNSVGQIL